jgi:hypothetical protein
MYSAAKRQGVAAGLQRKETKCSRVKGVLAPSLDWTHTVKSLRRHRSLTLGARSPIRGLPW